uniref:Uncharacterized protein n=1 Tax=Anguilla anguilla TaxID=7936 RepID=A0A0E9S5L5_ANGAN
MCNNTNHCNNNNNNHNDCKITVIK